MAQFFGTVERYKRIVSLDLETTRAESRAEQAKAEAERWDAESAAKQVQSEARVSLINVVGSSLDQGLTADGLVYWSSIIERLGVTAEELASSLDEYSTIEILSANRQARADES